MKFLVDSDEYRAWHEVGHAVICLLLGGDVRFIEFLDGTGRGFARTRCIIPPEINQSVACAGFAAEFFVLKNGLAEQAPGDVRPINQVLFHNAYEDREDFQGRTLKSEETFSEAVDTAFRDHAIGTDGRGGLVPIFDRVHPQVKEIVRELCQSKRLEGRRVKELLQRGGPPTTAD